MTRAGTAYMSLRRAWGSTSDASLASSRDASVVQLIEECTRAVLVVPYVMIWLSKRVSRSLEDANEPLL